MTLPNPAFQQLEHKLTIVEEVAQASAGKNLILRGLIALQMQKYLKESNTWWDSMSSKSVAQWVEMAIADLRSASNGPSDEQGREPAEGYSIQLTRAFQ